MMSLWDALRMNMMISYQELVRTFPSTWQELKKCLFPHRYGSLSADSWRVIPGKHSVDEQPIVDYWLKRMADAKKLIEL
ncbi:Uncharacterised protein (plasmid) [Escherichia coli]|nr:Uncharacterised protein [Escherichia coli]